MPRSESCPSRDASVSRRQLLLQALQHCGDVVHGLLHLLVVALVGLRDQFVDLAVGDLGQNAVAFADGQQDGIQHLVDALDDLAVVALVLGGVGAGGQFAFRRRLDQHAGLGHQRVDGVDAVVQVVLDLVEVAVVGVGDLGRDVALGDAVHVLGGDVQRADHRVQRLVDALDDLAVVALVLGGIGAGGQLAFHGAFVSSARRRPPARSTASMQAFRLFLISLKSPL